MEPENKKEHSQAAPKKKFSIFPVILALLVLGGGWFGYSKYQYGLHHEETDDAQIGTDISPVIPRISGYVDQVRVKDNQFVKKGDTLLILDNRDLKIKLEQAEAALGIAQTNLGTARAATVAAKSGIKTSKAAISTIDAQIEAVKVTLWRATQDYDRYANLLKDHSITQQQYEQALAAKQSAEKQLDILKQQKNQANEQTSSVTTQSNATASQIDVANANIRQKEVDIDAARLNLTFTVVLAPDDGLVSKVNVQAGQYVQAGQSLFSIVHSERIWVIANFKETQLNKMTEGQFAIVKADVFPKHEFKAKVSSFSPATGSTFALLPPDNASGNFVKVVQRLPVKIEFSEPSDSLIKKLKPGMNVQVDVHLD